MQARKPTAFRALLAAFAVVALYYPWSLFRLQRLKLLLAVCQLDAESANWRFWDLYYTAALERSGLSWRRDATSRVATFMAHAATQGYITPEDADELATIGAMRCRWQLTPHGRSTFRRKLRRILYHGSAYVPSRTIA